MKFTFKPFKGDKDASKSPDKSLPPAQRRREQVRRAQKYVFTTLARLM
jgi:hypothetical protein